MRAHDDLSFDTLPLDARIARGSLRALALGAVALAVGACTFNGSGAECVFDDDCRGDDLCEAGECIDPDDLDEDSDGGEGEAGEGEGEGGEGEGGEGEGEPGEGEGEGDCASAAAECAANQYTACTCAAADPCNWSGDGVCDATPCNDAFGVAFDDGDDCGGEPPPPPPPPPPADADGDGVEDAFDNCPNAVNAFQENRDTDAFGDACDPSTYQSFTATLLENRDRCDDGSGPPAGATSSDLMCWRVQIGDDVLLSRLRAFDGDAFIAHDEFQAFNPSKYCGRHEVVVRRDDLTGELFLLGELSFAQVAAGTTFTSTFKNAWFSTSSAGNRLASELDMECPSGQGGTCSDLSIHMALSSQSAFTAIDFQCDAFGQPLVTGFDPL